MAFCCEQLSWRSAGALGSWRIVAPWGEALGSFAQELAPSGVRVGLEPQGRAKGLGDRRRGGAGRAKGFD